MSPVAAVPGDVPWMGAMYEGNKSQLLKYSSCLDLERERNAWRPHTSTFKCQCLLYLGNMKNKAFPEWFI